MTARGISTSANGAARTVSWPTWVARMDQRPDSRCRTSSVRAAGSISQAYGTPSRAYTASLLALSSAAVEGERISQTQSGASVVKAPSGNRASSRATSPPSLGRGRPPPGAVPARRQSTSRPGRRLRGGMGRTAANRAPSRRGHAGRPVAPTCEARPGRSPPPSSRAPSGDRRRSLAGRTGAHAAHPAFYLSVPAEAMPHSRLRTGAFRDGVTQIPRFCHAGRAGRMPCCVGGDMRASHARPWSRREPECSRPRRQRFARRRAGVRSDTPPAPRSSGCDSSRTSPSRR